MDSEEEEKEVKEAGGAEEGLPASQPQPTLNQVLLEDEDLIIEEYISDWALCTVSTDTFVCSRGSSLLCE